MLLLKDVPTAEAGVMFHWFEIVCLHAGRSTFVMKR